MVYIPEPLETESAKAYDAFMMYCRLGAQNRSINNLSRLRIDSGIDNGDNTTTLAVWSSANRWVERVQRYDIEKQRELEQSVRDRKLSLLDKLGAVLEEAVNNVDVSNPSLQQVTTGIRSYIQSALETLNELPTSRTLTGNIDMSFEELLKLYEQQRNDSSNIIDG